MNSLCWACQRRLALLVGDGTQWPTALGRWMVVVLAVVLFIFISIFGFVMVFLA